jgi:hypothetical protein
MYIDAGVKGTDAVLIVYVCVAILVLRFPILQLSGLIGDSSCLVNQKFV